MTDHHAEEALSMLTGEIHDLTTLPSPASGGGAGGEGAHPRLPEKIHLTHLPAGAPHFLGREPELAALDAAWASHGKTAMVELIAPGGVGKTALSKCWLDQLKATGWRGAEKVFAWSFYSQGTGDDRQASEDHFLAQAIEWFGLDIDSALNPADKGQKLAEAVAASRTLLILDGLEPLQHPPGPLAGALRAPGVQTLLTHLATAGSAGLCLVSSREWLKDLVEWVRPDDGPDGPVLRIDLGNLNDADGARLLHKEGANRAGAAKIAPDDNELLAASRAEKGHALTLTLLGRYLAMAYDGDIRQWEQVDFQEADAETSDGHAFRVMAAYENWFLQAGDKGARQLAAFRLLGYFDQSASRDCLRVLRTQPAIPGLTRPLVALKPEIWKTTLKQLAACGLVQVDEETGAVDSHALIKQYLARRLEQELPEAWREGHRRIYEYLKTHAPHHPDTLAGLQPLYQAVAHGCRAGLYEETLVEVYRDRILRGTGDNGFYSTMKLGAIGANLGAVTSLFAEPWRRPAPALSEAAQAWLLNEAAFHLRALGRLAEALDPMRAGAEMYVDQSNWQAAAITYSNLSDLQLSLGRIDQAIADAASAVDYADRSGEWSQRVGPLTTLADARHQGGELESARKGFVEAEAMQVKEQPQYPLLYSLQGFKYCDLLLAETERAVWRGESGGAAGVGWADAMKSNAAESGFAPQLNLQLIKQMNQRATQTAEWVKGKLGLLDEVLDRLTLARCALYANHLHARPPCTEAQDHAEAAVTGLRAAGDQTRLPRGLLTRAWLRHALADIQGAEADLAEAQRIAARGGMRLHLADIALTRARLFRDPAQLAVARRLIEECGYWRRKEELEDAEAALGVPSPLRGEG